MGFFNPPPPKRCRKWKISGIIYTFIKIGKKKTSEERQKIQWLGERTMKCLPKCSFKQQRTIIQEDMGNMYQLYCKKQLSMQPSPPGRSITDDIVALQLAHVVISLFPTPVYTNCLLPSRLSDYYGLVLHLAAGAGL